MSVNQDFVTVAIPFGDKSEWCDVGDIEREIGELGNPANEAMATALRQTGVVHFASIHAIPPKRRESRPIWCSKPPSMATPDVRSI
ncbi:hypothetical protein C7W88_07925 [Novosphingobium sp. THN1]|uniref:hypothetical protein n=1 Tax=Novosphingobium sp. THN1 TaxID=1016987 RepID=UPI000E4ED3F5|nr:hypothetical protein [Novosphingobium sp. THN1]AXU18974.1 hypothetical protein C7W88_07925 [Novosphingobium sp. THN1]